MKYIITNEAIRLIGYHGTSNANAKKILDEGFVAHKRDDHWLGQGIYFFLNDFEEAKRWIFYATHKSVGIVIKAAISVNEENYLDLDTSSGFDYLKQQYETFKQNVKKDGIVIEPFDSKAEHLFECAVLDLTLDENIHVISKTYPRQVKNNDESRFNRTFQKRQKQLCVRNTDCINVIGHKEVRKNEREDRLSKSIG